MAGEVGGRQGLPHGRGPEYPKDKRRYVLDMFPYPSGAGPPRGPPEDYTITDIYCRYLRMNGFNVLHPWASTPSACPPKTTRYKTGTHPAVTTQANVDRFREQIKSLGFSLRLGPRVLDLRRPITTSGPSGYSSSSSSAASPTRPTCPSTGAPPARPAWPTRKSRTASATAAAPRSRASAQAVGAQDHRLRRPAPGGPRRPGLAGADQADAAQLDRPIRGRLGTLRHRGLRRETRRFSRPAPTRSSASPTWSSRPSIPSSRKITSSSARTRPWRPTSRPPRARATSSARTWPRTRRASSPAPTRSTP